MEEEKESELAEAQEELRVAQEEVLLLQQAAEEAAAERENDIASLQEELCRRRAELQRLSEETQEYDLEITTLRAEISMKSQRREAERREGEGRRACGGGDTLKSKEITAIVLLQCNNLLGSPGSSHSCHKPSTRTPLQIIYTSSGTNAPADIGPPAETCGLPHHRNSLRDVLPLYNFILLHQIYHTVQLGFYSSSSLFCVKQQSVRRTHETEPHCLWCECE